MISDIHGRHIGRLIHDFAASLVTEGASGKGTVPALVDIGAADPTVLDLHAHFARPIRTFTAGSSHTIMR
jgi:hypothetical protein